MKVRFIFFTAIATIIFYSGACQAGEAERMETRAVCVWYSSYDTQEKADQLIEDLEYAGFNTIYGMVYWYRAFYASNEYPRADFIDQSDFDPVGYLIEQAQQRGWKFKAWFVNTRIDPELTPDYDTYDDWRIIDWEGNKHEQRRDYNIPEFREYEIRKMLEFVELYPHVDGILFDYIRQHPPLGSYAYTDIARELFQEEAGVDPWDLVHEKESFDETVHERLWQQWLRWQRDNLTKVVQAVYEGTKEINPDVLVGAFVFSPPSRAENANQHWWNWVNEGMLDFDNYVEKNRCPEYERLVNEEAVWFRQSMLLGNRSDMDDIAAAIRKIHRHAGRIKQQTDA